MKHNTDTLGFKLLSGRLKKSRIHSEQLNKYCAGLFDSDGTICLSFQKGRGIWRVYPLAVITQSASNDPDFSLIRSLRDFYNIGSLSFSVGTDTHKSSYCEWRLSGKSAEKLYNLIGKHLMIKASHFKFILDTCNLNAGIQEEKERLLLKQLSKTSRACSTFLKTPKHISPVWLAGFLDGDGYFRCRVGRRLYRKGREYIRNYLHVSVSLSKEDSFILDFIQKDYGGRVDHSSEYPRWTKGLGVGNMSSSVRLLRLLRKYSCLEKKYLIIEDMIMFHQEPAETKQA